MAKRRMFSMDIIDTDMFLEMSSTTQLLYFHLSMRADDDGLISSPKRIIRLIGASDDDLRILFSKQFVIPFDSGVCVIKHWKIHNYIQKDRYHETIYREEKLMLKEDMNGAYKMDTECIHDVSKMDTQVRLGKVSLGKSKSNISAQTEESVSAVFSLPSLGGKEFPITEELFQTFKDAYPAVDVMAELSKMKAWLLSNKKNLKKDVTRFANNWLSRAQDKAERPSFGQGGKPSQRTLGNEDRWDMPKPLQKEL